MRPIFTLLLGIFSINSFGQCDPLAYNWGTNVWGFAPFTIPGDDIPDGFLGEPYHHDIYIWVPNTTYVFGAVGIPIDSLALDSITANINGVDISISNIGLSYTCNNNGTSANSCTFPATIKCCGSLIGTPTNIGTFDLKAYTTWWGMIAGTPISSQYVSPVRSISIINSTSIIEFSLEKSKLLNSPNPAGDFTDVNFELENSAEVSMIVYNLLGEVFFRTQINASKGPNKYRLETSGFPNGVYLLTLDAGKGLFGKLNVQH